jgi:hypothetical protein
MNFTFFIHNSAINHAEVARTKRYKIPKHWIVSIVNPTLNLVHQVFADKLWLTLLQNPGKALPLVKHKLAAFSVCSAYHKIRFNKVCAISRETRAISANNCKVAGRKVHDDRKDGRSVFDWLEKVLASSRAILPYYSRDWTEYIQASMKVLIQEPRNFSLCSHA